MQPSTTIKFHRVYPAAIPPMRADKSALGLMPTMAFRHCEPMRAASSFGWYAFAAEEVHLRWNGADVLVKVDEGWQPLSRMELPGFVDYWNGRAPESVRDLAPPFLTRLPIPGLVQIWTGLLCSTALGWSVLVRSPSNMRGSFLYATHEGIVETDRFKPCPLFMNVQLLATDVDIVIPKTVPLLQVQPLLRKTYDAVAHSWHVTDGLDAQLDGRPALSPEEWRAYRQTIRVDVEDEAPEAGHYAADARKRAKATPQTSAASTRKRTRR
jgi:hypothetical protein